MKVLLNGYMVTSELAAWVKGQLLLGKSKPELKTVLLSQGWEERDVNEALGIKPALETISPEAKAVLEREDPAEQGEQQLFDFKQMAWYEYLAVVPALILFAWGGALGAGFGAMGWTLSLKVMRNESLSKGSKTGIVALITVGYFMLYMVIGSFVVGMMNGLVGDGG